MCTLVDPNFTYYLFSRGFSKEARIKSILHTGDGL